MEHVKDRDRRGRKIKITAAVEEVFVDTVTKDQYGREKALVQLGLQSKGLLLCASVDQAGKLYKLQMAEVWNGLRQTPIMTPDFQRHRDSKQLAENIVLSTFTGWRDMGAKNIRRLHRLQNSNLKRYEILRHYLTDSNGHRSLR